MILFYKQKKCLFFRLRKDQKILFTIQLVKLKDWEIFKDYQNLPYDARVLRFNEFNTNENILLLISIKDWGITNAF